MLAVVEEESLDEIAGRVEPGVPELVERREEDVTVRDALGAPMEGGAAAGLAVEVAEALALGGSLSQVVKKSSDGSLLGVEVPRGVSSRPSI